MIPPPKEEMVITESRVLTNAKNHTVVHFLKNCLPYHLCNTLFHSIEELQSSDLRPDHDKSRKIDKLYHFGHWRFYTKDIREAKKTAMAPAREWIATNGPLFDHLAGLLTKFYPHLREEYELLPQSQRLFNLWSLVAINLNTPSYPHVDKNDYRGGFCVVVPVGDWEQGGELHFSGLNATMVARPKDIVVFEAHNLKHENRPWPMGQTRHSIVLTTSHNLFNAKETVSLVQ